MAKLVVRLLGGFRVELDGEAVYGFETDKARALLAYLVVEANRPHRRETLASLLWPDWPEAVARTNLRLTLSRVRRALTAATPSEIALSGNVPLETPPFLFVSTRDIQFNAASDYSLDVAELESFARSPAAREELLPEGLCADFLAGFAVPDSEAFQAWVLNKQEHYHRLALETLGAQNAYFESTGEYGQAAAAARLQLHLEPWLEEAHQRCIRALALAGRREEALHQYEACCRVLKNELDLEPDAETQALCAAIRAGKLVATGMPRPSSERRTRVAAPAPSRVGQLPTKLPQDLLLQTAPALVAREDELGRLTRHLERVVAGETGVIFVSGEAGSGKTMLLEAFAEAAMVEHPDLLVACARCSPGGSLDPLAPLRKLAEMLFGDFASPTAWRLRGSEQGDRLRSATGLLLASLQEYGVDLIDTLVPAASIARRAGKAVAAPPARPAAQATLFDGLACTLGAVARERPLLLLLDDLHWVDDATAALLLHLGRELTGSPLLVLGAYRSNAVAAGRRDSRSGAITRHPLASVVNELRGATGEIVVELDRANGRAFVEALVDNEPNRLGARFRDALYSQTGGHALFTVELLRNLQARGELFKDEAGRWVARDSLDWGDLPARVEFVIAERIERLPEADRRILDGASVQGEDFSGEVVAELVRLPLAEVLACLSGSLARQHGLVRPQGLRRLGTGQQSIYRFAHHLFQKYLYDELDPVERAHMHAAVAGALTRQIGDDAEGARLSGRLAWHFENGGMPLEAARALHDAGRQAMRVSAFREALVMFDHGLELLATEVSPGRHTPAERSEIRRLLEAARLGPQHNLGGAGGAELASVLARAGEAGARDASGRPRLLVLLSEGELQSSQGQLEESLITARQMLDLAMEWGDDAFVGFAHWQIGFVDNLMGKLQEAQREFDWVLGWITPEREAELHAVIGFGVTAQTLAFSGWGLWWLGYPQQALERCRQAVDGAAERADPYGEAFATACLCPVLFLLRSDEGALQARAEQGYRLCLRHGFGMWQPYLEVFLGWSEATSGAAATAEPGATRMQRAIAAWQAKGMAIGLDYLTTVLATGCLAAARQAKSGDGGLTQGLLEAGLRAIEPLLAPGARCSHSHQAELHRLRGELLLERHGLGASAEALACFERALQIGRAQGALAWELRAAMSLVRLQQRQGEGYAVDLARARAGLRAIYARFTEGLDYPDLQDAALLIGNHPCQGIR